MKNFSSDLMALLAAGVPMDTPELFMIGPCKNGAMIYASNGPRVIYGGHSYEPAAFGAWSRGTITTKLGLESTSCDLTVFADNQVPVYFPGTSGAALLMDGIKATLLANAPVTILRLYNSEYLPGYAFPAVTGPTGGSLVETLFVGFVGPIPRIGMTKAMITAQDMNYLLNQQTPKKLIASSCTHVFCDVGCTMSKAAFTKTGAVGVVTYAYQFVSSAHLAPTSAAGTFALGVLTWTSGANAGLSCQVRVWTPGGSTDTFQLDVQPIFPITVGDAFSVVQGCTKLLTSCTDIQGATQAMVNFGGDPNTPVPETAVG